MENLIHLKIYVFLLIIVNCSVTQASKSSMIYCLIRGKLTNQGDLHIKEHIRILHGGSTFYLLSIDLK
jgi:hypothetical protein